jgi:hypothetical protein
MEQTGETFLSLAKHPLTRVKENLLHQMQKRSEKLWRSIVIPLCISSTILWDTFSFLAEPLYPKNKISSVPRSVRRKSDRRLNLIRPNHLPLYFFLASWLVLSGTICVDCAAYNGHAHTHPLQLLSNSVEQTYRRIQNLDTLVDLSPGTFTQYQALQAKNDGQKHFQSQRRNSRNVIVTTIILTRTKIFQSKLEIISSTRSKNSSLTTMKIYVMY